MSEKPKKKHRPSKWRKPTGETAMIGLLQNLPPQQKRKLRAPEVRLCGRCRAPAPFGVAYPGIDVPPKRAGKVLWACAAHRAGAQAVVRGWLEADGNTGWLARWDQLCRDSMRELLPETPDP